MSSFGIVISQRALATLLVCLAALFLPTARALDPNKALHQYRQDNWSTPQGLPQVSVQAIAQDRTRFLWFGTQVGLTRFDGRNFKNFTPDSYPGLAHNYINFILTLADDSVWIATRAGLSRYHQGTIAIIAEQTEVGNVNHLLEHQGWIYVACANGLLRIQTTNLNQHEWLFKQEVDRVGLLGGDIAFGSGTRLLKLNLQRDVQELAQLPAQLSWFSNDRNGHAWLGTYSGLLQWRDGALTRVFKQTELNERLIESVLHDRDNNLWIATQFGTFRARYDNPTESAALLDTRHKRSLFEDHEGSLWIGTQTDGVARLWNGYMTRVSAPEGLTEELIWSLYQDPQGTLWAQTDNGVYRQQGERFELQWSSEQLPHRKVLSAFQSADGTFWVGTAQGLAAFRQNKRVLQNELKALDDALIYNFHERKDGLWIGTRQGLYRWRNGILERPESFVGMPITAVRAMVSDKDNRLWLGTSSGLFSYGVNGAFQAEAVEIIQQDMVMTILIDPQGIIWAGTQGKGLFRLQQGKWKHYDESMGLFANTLFHVNRIGDSLWLSSHKGIFSLGYRQFDDFDAGKIHVLNPRVFGASSQTDRAECNGGSNQAGLVDTFNRFLCPTIDGIVIIDPSALSFATTDVTLHITDWRYASAESGAFWPMTGGRLPAGVGNLEIDYVALSYREPMQTRYRYRLVGDGRDWVQAGNRVTAYFHSLPPGPYTLEVGAVTEDGSEPASTAKLNFRVLPFYYQTLWFRALLIALIGASLLALFLWRYHLLNARKAILEELVEKRTTELKQVNEQLQRASRTDPLTQLGNRRYVVERIPQDIALTRRSHLRRSEEENRDIIFVMLDIDHFKQINDKYGHAVGDAVLSEVGHRITGSIRDSDYAVRWGGEEFLIVGRCANPLQSQNLPDRILHAIADQPIKVNADTTLHVTCSIGFAHYPFLAEALDAVSWEQIVAIADAALYLAKTGGRNQWIGITATEHFTEADLMLLSGKAAHSELIANGKLTQLSSRKTGSVA